MHCSSHENLTGHRYGRILVGSFVGRNDSGNAMWSCHCDCGCDFIALGYNLKTGRTRSCGCYRSEETSKRNKERFRK